jgi:uridine phosphorylase
LPSASRPEVGGRPYHLMVSPGDIAGYVLLPGDPGRVARIARYWDEARLVGDHRGFVSYTGRYKGVGISAVSTGIGGPSTAIVVEELLRLGAHTFIRVGTTGAIVDYIDVGDLVINIASVRMEGTSKAYVMPEYPAVASLDVTLALIFAAENLGVKYHVGIGASTDSFYVGQERPGFKGYIPPWSRGLMELLGSVRVLNFEMEASTIFTLANIYRARAGSVCAVVASRPKDILVPEAGVNDAIKVANEAVVILNEWDKLEEQLGSKAKAIREWARR